MNNNFEWDFLERVYLHSSERNTRTVVIGFAAHEHEKFVSKICRKLLSLPSAETKRTK